jgi:arabinofuranosyltransferase
VLQGRLVAGRAQSPTKFFMPLSTSAAATADRLFAACGFVLLTLLAWAILRHQDLIDDAYITARYADNLAHGYGWAWNPGAAPTDGTTAPLWTLLLAGISRSSLPFVSATLALDAIFYGLLGLCGYLLVGKLAGRVAAAIFLAITAAFAILLPSCAGMETPLYGTLLMASFLAWHCDRRRAAFALAGLLPLVRGDGLLVWGVLCGAMLLERRVREFWPAALAALLPLACWELFSL